MNAMVDHWLTAPNEATHHGVFTDAGRSLYYKDIVFGSYSFFDAHRGVWNLMKGEPKADTIEERPSSIPPSRIFTAFCQQANGQGTIWIQAVEGSSIEDAVDTARGDCAFDWGCSPEHVHCLGLIEGEPLVAYWDDNV